MRATPLTELAKAGFQDLSSSSTALDALAEHSGIPRADWLTHFSVAPDADRALRHALELSEQASAQWKQAKLLSDAARRERLLRLLGTSNGLAEYLKRDPKELPAACAEAGELLTAEAYTSSMLDAVGVKVGNANETTHFATVVGEEGWSALRMRYRHHLLRIAMVDLDAQDPREVFPAIAAALSDLAGAALEAGLAVARAAVRDGFGVGKRYTRKEVEATKLAVIAMGKCGSRELNYVSDVDVIFVADTADAETVSQETALACASRLATEMMRAIHDVSLEPPLWQVDPNLRPEGKQGALVRTLPSHLAYYDRWAKSWEFQALLKARFVAGDAALGGDYVAQTRPLVWSSASRENFVESAQNMRERVMEHIPERELDYQIKLGPGGLRDVEFTIQLLQLVHGQKNEGVRVSATLDAIEALATGGFVARADAESLSLAYRELRVIEHRLQLRELARTALVPQDEDDQRWLGRASKLASSAEQFMIRWENTKEQVRGLHLKIFYAPLLPAFAAMGESEFALTGEEAEDRLRAIGFRDPAGALRHIAALSKGVSRRATIQRNLLPVLLQWFSEGANPDYGLLAFRRISDSLGTTPWYLRLLRDGAGAALRLTKLLSSSQFVGELMEVIPESVAWLEGDEELAPVPLDELIDEMQAIARRHTPIEKAMPHLLQVRRREVLRLAMGSLLGVLSVGQVATGLTAVYDSLLDVVLRGVRRTSRDASATEEVADGIKFAIVAVGRFGGGDLSLSSDLDLMYVYRDVSLGAENAAKRAMFIATELQRLLADSKLPLELDLDLRPEGRSGVLVRSLDAYRSYYERWSLTWEAQALLKARCQIGDASLAADFIALADEIRYPAELTDDQVREIRRLKARVEAERLPHGADPARHLKLGKGSVSDVEWLVQLLQLKHAHEHEGLRTPSTMQALQACVDAELLSEHDALLLGEAWSLSSSLRTAHMLWANRASDVLPRDRSDLEGIARVLGFPAGSTTVLEDQYLAVTRRSRAVFEREFFGYAPEEPLSYTESTPS